MVLPPTPKPIKFTRFLATESTSPEVTLTKQFKVTDGVITKSGQPNFAYGNATTVEILELAELPSILDALSRNECIATGIFDEANCLIVPKGSSPAESGSLPVRNRSKEMMTQPSSGLLLLDYDFNERMPSELVCESVDALIDRITSAIPELASIGYVGAGSSSNGVYCEATGERYSGGGLHVYIVAESSDLEAFRDYLEVKLWNAGLGYIALAKNGARLKRTIIDLSVISQERLIYEASPILGEGLARHERKWCQHSGPALSISTAVSNEERESCQRKTADAMTDAHLIEQSDKTYETYRNSKVVDLAQVKGISVDEANSLCPVLSQEDREGKSLNLTGNDVVEINGNSITVAELISRGPELNGTAMPDPIEGSAYGSGTAMFYYNDGRTPCIHSFAHGLKTVYALPRVPAFSKLGQVVPLTQTQNPEPLDPSTFPHQRVSANGEIRLLATIQNIDHLLNGYGIKVRYNVIAKRISITIPGASGSPDNALNVALNRIVSLCTLNSISTGAVPSYVTTIADQNQVNEVADWIMSMPWDQVDRIPAILATLTIRADFPGSLKRALVYRWLLSCVAAALKPSGFSARGVLTLQGPQGIGKTSWIRSLVTPQMLRETTVLLGHHLDAGNKDSIITAVSHWIVELGELDSSFKKDIARLKGFITGNSDKVRRPYAMADSEYQRRTVFCATVNEQNFLVDPTGNSRWWTIPVITIDFTHDIDMQQLFVQLAEYLQKGEQWWLTPEEEGQLAEQNKEYRAVNVIEEKLLSEIDPDLPAQKWRKLSALQVLKRLGYDKPSNPQCRECGSVLRDHYGEPKKIQGTMKWLVPLRDSFGSLRSAE